MRSLVDFISEVRLPQAKINIKWYSCLTRGPRLDAADALAKNKIDIDAVFNLFVQWLCDTNNERTIDMIIGARNGLSTLEKKQVIAEFLIFTDKYRLRGLVPKDYQQQYSAISPMLTDIFSACLYGMRDGYLKYEIENYQNSQKVAAPKATGRLKVAGNFDKKSTADFTEYAEDANFPYNNSESVSLLNKVLVYIYHDAKMRKELTSKSFAQLAKDMFYTTAVDTAFVAWDIKDYNIDDEYLISSNVAEGLADLHKRKGGKWFKEMFEASSGQDDNYYIITDFADHADFIRQHLWGDLNAQVPGITIKYDKSIQYGLYGPKKLPGSTYAYSANSLPTFTAFLNMICRRYLENYKGPMPL